MTLLTGKTRRDGINNPELTATLGVQAIEAEFGLLNQAMPTTGFAGESEVSKAIRKATRTIAALSAGVMNGILKRDSSSDDVKEAIANYSPLTRQGLKRQGGGSQSTSSSKRIKSEESGNSDGSGDGT